MMIEHNEFIDADPSNRLCDPEERIEDLERALLLRDNQLKELTREIDYLKEELAFAADETAQVRRCYRTGIRRVTLGVAAALALALHAELCQVGWNLFLAVTGLLGLSERSAVGALTMALAVVALWQAGKWIIQVMLDDSDQEEERSTK